MKIIGKLILFFVVGLTASISTLIIQTRSNDSERETIGHQKEWGFPIAYRTTAPGLSWGEFNTNRFGMNTLAWAVAVGAIWTGTQRLKKKGSNKASEPTSG